MNKNRNGFTIVELLIVIVVIAILAAISVVAYNGIQQRSQNTARIANGNAAIKLINAYTAAYGVFPSTTGNSCIGDGFPLRTDLGYATCWGWDSATPSNRNTALNDTELKKIGSLPNNTTPPVPTPYWNGVGPVWWYDAARTVDGVSRPAAVIYFLAGGGQDCGASNPVIRQSSGSAYVTVTSSPRNTSTEGNSTFCYVALNNP